MVPLRSGLYWCMFNVPARTVFCAPVCCSLLFVPACCRRTIVVEEKPRSYCCCSRWRVLRALLLFPHLGDSSIVGVVALTSGCSPLSTLLYTLYGRISPRALGISGFLLHGLPRRHSCSLVNSMSRPSTVVDRIAGLFRSLSCPSVVVAGLFSLSFVAPVSTGLLSSLLALSVVVEAS
jgi:hypothetical protein